MKAGFFLIIAIILLGCNFKSTNTPIKNPNLITPRDSILLGGWTTCESKSGDMMITRNSCIKWLFQANHCGFVGLENATLHFDWRVAGDTLYIRNKIGNLFIENGKYSVKVRKNGNDRIVIISDTTQRQEYLLSGPPK
ncbi:hypothetical protein [Mucilaginibacter psychrotolerans]|uniref:Lipocalin-like domain-containing protein n=1 Tax=Mucilaginibacter psychrotolerans TaxID=1524096 RepID=A0A4Y8SGH3_9SPHI|nr:hypothetical protein [Mucilaginibacter psychrotolerans]TFF37972.1 hypothetical protein E2R66_10320 [Mucilaginibacter psychrotolerans]